MRIGGKFDEAHYQAEQTQIILDMHGEKISLKREPQLVDDGAGGVMPDPDHTGGTLAEQTFWFHEAAPTAHIARGTNFAEIINMGQRTTTGYVLLGMPDVNVRQHDTFKHGVHEYKVTYVHPDRAWQTIAEVERVADPQGDV